MTDFTFPSEMAPEPPPLVEAPPLPREPYEEGVVVPRHYVFDTSGRVFDPRDAPETVDARFGEGTPAGTPRRLMVRRFDEPPDGSADATDLTFVSAGSATRLTLSERGRFATEANAQHRHATRVRDAWSSSNQRASDDWRQRDYGPAPSKPRAPARGKRYR